MIQLPLKKRYLKLMTLCLFLCLFPNRFTTYKKTMDHSTLHHLQDYFFQRINACVFIAQGIK